MSFMLSYTITPGTWVPNTDVPRVVQCKWVFRTKFKADGSLDKYKARLVAKGFQQTTGMEFSETFSPVVKALIQC